ncbi:MAG: hypothetical protein R6V58_09655 [Planctomycetota bacterium]
MNRPDRGARPLLRGRMIAALVWMLAVCAAYVVAYSAALIELGRGSAGRLPLVRRVLDLLHLGT